MNKYTLYAVVYMATLLLLTGGLCEWATPLEFGGLSYGCGEEIPGFTVYDATKVFVSAALICAWGIVGMYYVLWKCSITHASETSDTGDK